MPFNPNRPWEYEEELNQLSQQPWQPPMVLPGMDNEQAQDEILPPQKRAVSAIPKDNGVPEDISQIVAGSIGKKYGYPQGMDDAALVDAQSRSNDSRLYANLGDAFDTLGRGIAGASKPADSAYYKGLADQAGIPVEQLLARRKAMQDNAAFQESQAMQDPMSISSQVGQRIAKQMGYDVSGLPLNQINKVSPLISAAEAAKGRIESAKLRGDLSKATLGNKQAEKEEKDVQKLSDKIGNSQDMVTALNNVENKLGFKLDDAQDINGKLVVKGKEIDLPGVSVQLPIIGGRYSAHSGDARKLQSAVAGVFNVELKDRSGAAVTSPEMQRMKEEFASGQYNTESEMIEALKNYRNATIAALKNREAAFKPEVLAKYKERGGMTSQDIPTKSSPSANSKYPPGSVIKVKGKQYRVGADGDSLEAL